MVEGNSYHCECELHGLTFEVSITEHRNNSPYVFIMRKLSEYPGCRCPTSFDFEKANHL